MADTGDKLRSAREAKGLSIADIEKTTKIQSRYLTAIEQNDFDKLPGDFYVRAFIRQYAQIVGLDGKELLSEYHQDLPESKPDEYVENSIDNKSEKVRETTDNKKNLWRNYLPKIAIVLGAIIVILIIYVLYARLSSSGKNNSNDNNVAITSQSSSKKSSTPVAKKKSSVKIAPLGNNQYRISGLKNNRKLEVKAGDIRTNATISVNGVMQWSNPLDAGQKHVYVLPADARNVVITFGNDRGSSIKIAGKRVKYSATGNYLSLTLLIEGAKTTNNNQSSSTANSYSYRQSNQRQTNQSSHVQSSSVQSSQRQTNQSSHSTVTQSSASTNQKQSH